MPFITEEIYQILPDPEESIMIALYPIKDPELINKSAEKKAAK